MTADGREDKLPNPGMVWHALRGLCTCEWVGWGASPTAETVERQSSLQQLTAALQAQAESHAFSESSW